MNTSRNNTGGRCSACTVGVVTVVDLHYDCYDFHGTIGGDTSPNNVLHNERFLLYSVYGTLDAGIIRLGFWCSACWGRHTCSHMYCFWAFTTYHIPLSILWAPRRPNGVSF
jgi:hypothetical protein